MGNLEKFKSLVGALGLDKSDVLTEQQEKEDLERRREELLMDLGSMSVNLSYSSLQCFKVSPRRFMNYKLKLREETTAMLEGTLFHCLTLEPDEYTKRYFDLTQDLPQGRNQKVFCCAMASEYDEYEAYRMSGYTASLLTKSGQVSKTAQNSIDKCQLEFEGLIKCLADVPEGVRIVAKTNADNARERADCVLRTKPARELIESVRTAGGFFERKINWQYRGVDFRGAVDGGIVGSMTLDLKQLGRDSSARTVRKAARYNGLAVQQAHYGVGLCQEEGLPPAQGFSWDAFIVAVDAEGDVSVTEIPFEQRLDALHRDNYYIDRFKENCLSGGPWDASHEFYAHHESGVFFSESYHRSGFSLGSLQDLAA